MLMIVALLINDAGVQRTVARHRLEQWVPWTTGGCIHCACTFWCLVDVAQVVMLPQADYLLRSLPACQLTNHQFICWFTAGSQATGGNIHQHCIVLRNLLPVTHQWLTLSAGQDHAAAFKYVWGWKREKMWEEEAHALGYACGQQQLTNAASATVYQPLSQVLLVVVIVSGTVAARCSLM